VLDMLQNATRMLRECYEETAPMEFSLYLFPVLKSTEQTLFSSDEMR